MGNNLICDNYYCQSVISKPEWIAENTWNISFIYHQDVKPYIIEKGIFKINNIFNSQILISKKLLIDLNDTFNIIIPIKLKYNLLLKNNIDFFIIISNNLLNIDSLNLSENNYYLFLKFNFKNNKLIILNNNENNNVNKKIIKINSNSQNLIEISLEKNFDFLIINEKILNNINENIFEKKYFQPLNTNINNYLYLNFFIVNNYKLNENEFFNFSLD
jgi:hypothetical protein